MNDLIVKEIVSGITALVFGVVIISCLTLIVVTVVRELKGRANTRTRADIYNRLIDKFGTAPEFIACLQSDAGLKFIEENMVQTAAPLSKILFSIQLGVVLTLLGLGLVFTGNYYGASLSEDSNIALSIGGIVGLMTGAGLLISAAISYWLCKAWGILGIKEKHDMS